MATLREYFENDFNQSLNVGKPLTLSSKTGSFEVQTRLHLDFRAGAKFISCYFPQCPEPAAAFMTVLNRLDLNLQSTNGLEIKTGYVGESPADAANFPFTGTVYFYSETEAADADLNELRGLASQKGITLRIRDVRFAI